MSYSLLVACGSQRCIARRSGCGCTVPPCLRCWCLAPDQSRRTGKRVRERWPAGRKTAPVPPRPAGLHSGTHKGGSGEYLACATHTTAKQVLLRQPLECRVLILPVSNVCCHDTNYRALDRSMERWPPFALLAPALCAACCVAAS